MTHGLNGQGTGLVVALHRRFFRAVKGVRGTAIRPFCTLFFLPTHNPLGLPETP